LHSQSDRKDNPFVSVSTSALLMTEESDELFGREKSGKVLQTGYIEQAENGTLFLKDIADLDLNLQARLHTALENGYITRTGGNRTISINVRVIAATHCDLSERVKSGLFRDDLYFMLSVLPV